MTRHSDTIMARWADENRQMGYARRDWHAGYRLTALCVALLVAGLACDLLLHIQTAAIACWIAAAASGVALLVRFYHSRFFIYRPGA